MTDSSTEVLDRVTRILASALDRETAEIELGSSLIDDLDAESIDFLDIQFRLEDEFAIEIAEDEIWQGSLDFSDTRWMQDDLVTAEGLQRLKELQPDYPWERLDSEIRKADLPRLITVRTIANFISSRIASESDTDD